METIAMVLIMAVIAEALVQVVKGLVPDTVNAPAWLWPMVGAVFGVLLCVLASVDVFPLLGFTLSVPILGRMLTGVLISRGASFVHDVWSRINDITAPHTDITLNGFTETKTEKTAGTDNG